jgi:hypothetical protein
MPGLKGDDPMLRRKVLADLVASRSRSGMRAIPRSGSTSAKGRKISDVAQVRKKGSG